MNNKPVDNEIDELVRDIMKVPYSKSEAKARLLQWGTRQQIKSLDSVIDIYNVLFEPNGEFRSFGSLKKEDVAELYLRIGEYIRELEASLKDGEQANKEVSDE